MQLESIGGSMVYFVSREGPSISSEQDALDLIAATFGEGIDIIVVPVDRLEPSFFDLRSRKAGNFFQKMQNYNVRLVILGDVSGWAAVSKPLRDFISETNLLGRHFFAADQRALETILLRER